LFCIISYFNIVINYIALYISLDINTSLDKHIRFA